MLRVVVTKFEVILLLLRLFLFSAMIVAPNVWLSSLSMKIPEDQKDSTNLTIYACLVSTSLSFLSLELMGSF